jgi:inner membrane protein
MMQNLLPLAGNWFWWIAAGIMLFVELVAPGVFFIWLALAAASVGIVVYFIDLSWPVEAVLFAGFSLVYVYLAAPWYSKNKHVPTDLPNLNQRIYDHVGKNFVLAEPIVGGQGKLNIGGTRWDIVGPDLAAGAKIHVSGVDGQKLRVTGA